MGDPPVVTTERLVLRGFRAEDLPAHRAAVDDDAAVTWAHVRLPLADSLRRWADRLDGWTREGFGMWIVEVRGTGAVIGHAGLQRLHGTDDVELGYYLGRPAWGQGYATEAGRACLAYGFKRCGLRRIVAVVRVRTRPLGTFWRSSASGTSATGSSTTRKRPSWRSPACLDEVTARWW